MFTETVGQTAFSLQTSQRGSVGDAKQLLLVLDRLTAQDDEDDVTTLDHSGVDCLAWVHLKILCTCRMPNKSITSEEVLI